MDLQDKIDEIYNILLTSDYSREVFVSLSGQRKDSRTDIKTDCPYCGGNDFTYSLVNPLFYCHNCNERGNWIKYLQDIEGLEFMEAVQRLADKAGVEIEELNTSQKRRYEEKKKKANILEIAQDFFKKSLWAKEGKEVFDYLTNRGYTEQEIKEMDLGAYVNREDLIKELESKGYSKKEMSKAGLFTGGNKFGYGITHKLTTLWRSQSGKGLGLVCRCLKDDIEPKYLYSKGMKRNKGLLGLTTARGNKEIVLVEGIMDSLYLNEKDIPAIAVGGTSLSLEQIRALENAGVKEVYIAFDDDRNKKENRGQDGAERVIKSLRGSSLRVYVINRLEGYDPDEYIRNLGADCFKDIMNLALSWSRWLAQHTIKKYDDGTDRGKDRAIEKCVNYCIEIDDSIARKEFKKEFLNLSELEEEELEEKIKDKKIEQTTKESELAAKNLAHNLQSLLKDESSITKIEELLENGIHEIKKNRGVNTPEPYLVDDFLQDIVESKEGLVTGYKPLDLILKIPQGALTFIVGRPGHGKTTFMLNLLLNQIKFYPDRSFYFFSYEEGRKRIAQKIIMNLAGVELHEKLNLNAYTNYFKEKRGTNEKIEKAIDQFREYTSQGRLYIIDKSMKAEDLASTIHYTADSQDDIGAVFIDYIQKIRSNKKGIDDERLHIQEASELLRDTSKTLDIPIVSGAQAKRGSHTKIKQDDIKSCGDIEQDANLILGIFNKLAHGDREEGENEFYGMDKIPFQINVVKSRQGGALGAVKELSLKGSTFKVEQREDTGGLY